jgi:thiamine-monophosphate kinase
MKVKDIGEFGFIDRVREGSVVRRKGLIRGIGDDCCVFASSRGLLTLFTTDMLVQEVHFLLDLTPPYKLGRKSLAVNISDIAAMGGIPREALISLAIPETVEIDYLDSLYDGMKSIAREFAVNLAGGDTSLSPRHLIISVAMVGEVREDEIVYRSGAGEGEVVFLTGPVGSSAAGLDMSLSRRFSQGQEEFLNAHWDPLPHFKQGRIIAASGLARSLIDVSDGVCADLGHICAASDVGAVIEEERIPTIAGFRDYCQRFELDPKDLSLRVGEDYVLLGTVPQESRGELEEALRSEGCEFFPIGTTVAGSGVRLRGRDGSVELLGGGWNHFGAE